MTKVKLIRGIIRDEYLNRVVRCNACKWPFYSMEEWDDRHECTGDDSVYHAYCCPVCNQDDTPDCHSDAEGGL